MSDEFPPSRSMGLPITIIVVGAVAAGVFLLQRSGGVTPPMSPLPVAMAEPTVAGVRVAPGTVVVDEHDPTLGSDQAPTTIFLFSQFNCSYCRHFFEATLPQLQEQLIKTGKVRLVFKVFPLGEDEESVVQTERAARAAWCAHEQNRFWSYAQRLSAVGARYEETDVQEYARAEQLDGVAFTSCLASEASADGVASGIRSALAAGITGTPTFIINDELHEGALSYAEITELLPSL